ncbi:MAG: glycine--tRNA ligase subunit beta [Alcanivoracaceae bacterium]|nr:glycine--tRNA ligase subunit beta [Alcanivoracaceae bacterium]
MQHADLLVELGTEELPPTALKSLSEAFANEVLRQVDDAGLSHGEMTVFASPRRLAFRISELAARQPDRQSERRGPAVKAAFDGDGNPTRAAQGFAESVGLEVNQLDTMETDKGAWLVARVEEKGKALAELLPDFLEQSVQRLPIPKRMRWGNRKAQFVRPVQWLVVLHGSEVVPLELLEHTSGRVSMGHRFHGVGEISLADAGEYEQRLEKDGFVIADFARRQAMVLEQSEKAGRDAGGKAAIDPDLLEEVTALVEWPVAMVGRFEEEFLRVPQEALITTMEENQKYFPVLDDNGKLVNAFVFVSNIDSRDRSVVSSGNEKVVRPRLADAAFFYDVDSKKTLAQHAEPLKNVVFQQQLGSVADKCARVAELASIIARQIGGDESLARQAGELCKADLSSDMVYEFDTMQGTMGYYLARNEGLDNEIAEAMREQYLPRFSGDQLPATRTGQAVALADKLDTLVGIFGIGQKPTGDKDPFALRRATLGILRIIIECALPVDIETLIADAAALLGDRIDKGNTADAIEFVRARYRAMYQEQGIATPVILSVLAINPTRPLDVDRRIRAVAGFQQLPEAAALAAANKRVANILSKHDGEVSGHVDSGKFEQQEENALADAIATARDAVEPLAARGDYAGVLQTLAALRAPVDAFFDTVMVMADDAAVRDNRLALLASLRALFLHVADISELG